MAMLVSARCEGTTVILFNAIATKGGDLNTVRGE